MTTNPYIDWWQDADEHDLLKDLMAEAIQFYGFDLVYLPRTIVREDVLYKEDILSKFANNTFVVEGYINNIAGFQGEADFLSKFGLQIKDRIDFLISKNRFVTVANNVVSRPNEGDLIYLKTPFNLLFEIKHVEHEAPFYSLGNLLCYKLECELFAYSHQNLETGNTVIDAFEGNKAFALELTLSGGSGGFSIGETIFQGDSLNEATAKAVVVAWSDPVARITDIIGTFVEGQPVQGVTTGNRYTVDATPDVLEPTNEPSDVNRFVEDEAADVIDFSDVNPITGQRS